MPDYEEPRGHNAESSPERATDQHRGRETITAKEYREAMEERERLLAERARLQERREKLEASKTHEPAEAPEPIKVPEPEPKPEPTLEPESKPEPEPESEPTPEPPEAPEAPETPREARKNKTKKNRALKRVLITAAALASAVAIGLSVYGGLFGSSKESESNSKLNNSEGESISDTANDGDTTESIDDFEIQEAMGIRDKYDEFGKWCSKNKSSDVNFACAAEVSEVCENNPIEMVKYVADGQVEALSDYMPFLPQQLLPEEFRNRSITKMEQYLESLSAADFDSTQHHVFNEIMDRALTRPYFANGQCDNAYMRLKDLNGKVVHENMELVRCTTNENKKFTEFYWVDANGNEIGSMIVKMSPVYDNDGNLIGYDGCMQVITPTGEKSQLYDDLSEIPDPEAPTPETKPNTPAPKDYDNLARIDENINNDIADDIHTDDIEISQTEDVATTTPETPKAPAKKYTGTEPTIVKNEAAEEAEPIGEGASTPISQENDYSNDLGGANAGNAQENPVQPDDKGQAAANEAAQEYNENNTPHAPGYGSGASTDGGGYYTIDDLLNP